jgi:Domain of unknown function (DUF4440)
MRSDMHDRTPASPGATTTGAAPHPVQDDLPDPSRFATLAEGIQALEARRIQALLQADVGVLLRLHAPTYQLITPSGTTFTRERYLRLMGDGTLRYLRWDAQAMAVRCSVGAESGAGMAIVRYRVTLQLGGAEGPGTPFECWHTDSYERFDGEPGRPWQAVWSQATQIKS